MRHGTMMFRGLPGAKVVAFTRSTDGSGDPEAASSTTHYGSDAAAVTLTRTGTGVYVLTWQLGDYGANLAFVGATVALGSGDWTNRVAINRAATSSTGTVTITLISGGSATNVVSGAISVMLVFGPAAP